MAEEILLPKQGNSVESCIIVEWKVDEGSAVTTGQPLMEVETDKATMEVESTADGVLLRKLVAEGDDVPVLSVIALVGAEDETIDESAYASASSGAVAGSPATDNATTGSVTVAERSEKSESVVRGRTSRHRGGAKISPRARRLATQRGVVFDGLPGSGPGGRIMVRDIEAAVASGGAGLTTSQEAAPDAGAQTDAPVGSWISGAPATPVSETKVSGVRKVIASRMHQSLAGTAQLTMSGSADARAILGYRKKLKAHTDERFASISINDLVLFAASRAVAKNRFVNATFADGTIREYAQVDLGFAVDTDKGLMVPVIRGADRMTLAALAAEAHRLASACQDGSITPDELDGGTFTVTNLGAFGIESFTPVLNVPQVAILGVCAVVDRPTAEGVVPRMGLSLTIDHQVVDGAPGARFLADVARAIEAIDITIAG